MRPVSHQAGRWRPGRPFERQLPRHTALRPQKTSHDCVHRGQHCQSSQSLGIHQSPVARSIRSSPLVQNLVTRVARQASHRQKLLSAAKYKFTESCYAAKPFGLAEGSRAHDDRSARPGVTPAKSSAGWNPARFGANGFDVPQGRAGFLSGFPGLLGARLRSIAGITLVALSNCEAT